MSTTLDPDLTLHLDLAVGTLVNPMTRDDIIALVDFMKTRPHLIENEVVHYVVGLFQLYLEDDDDLAPNEPPSARRTREETRYVEL